MAVGAMAACGLVVWLAAVAMAGGGALPEASLGVAGPLVVACGAWVAMQRTYRRQAEQLTALMIAGFGFKVLFFGAYVAFGLRGLGLRTRPFVGTLAAAFLVLHMVEAFFLSALFKERSGAAGTAGK